MTGLLKAIIFKKFLKHLDNHFNLCYTEIMEAR